MKDTKFEDVYELKGFLGKGAFGEVRKCICRETDEIFAVKEIQLSADEEAREKAENEAKVSAWLLALLNIEKAFEFHGLFVQ